MKIHSCSTTKGFTLLEMLVVIALTSMIVIAIVSSIIQVYRGNAYAFESADATRLARLGVEHAVRDMRESAYSDIGDYPVVSMTNDEFIFYSDVDRDASIERIRYFLDGDVLKKGNLEAVNDPPEYLTANETISIISTHVRNQTLGVDLFTYYDHSGVLMTDLSDVTQVAFVSIRLIVNINPQRAPEDYEVRSSAALRNINEEQ